MTQTPNHGGTAFPVCTGKHLYAEGMSLRAWIVGQCIASAFGGESVPITLGDGQTAEDALRDHWRHVAEAAVIAADETIAALNGGAA